MLKVGREAREGVTHRNRRLRPLCPLLSSPPHLTPEVGASEVRETQLTPAWQVVIIRATVSSGPRGVSDGSWCQLYVTSVLIVGVCLGVGWCKM